MGMFDFGKKRRSVKSHRKPPAKLLRICKKYRVKATKKSGGKRVYKSVATLKKLCLRKARALRKKLLKQYKKHKSSRKHSSHRKHSKKTVHRRRKNRMGEADLEDMAFGRSRIPMFGANARASRFGLDLFGVPIPGTNFGKKSRSSRFGAELLGMQIPFTNFGKRRATRKTSKTAAMKAFRSFYKRHCAGARRSRFGNGGNPPLYNSMGYEFCPNGMGGVLGVNSTGLFPSPCTSANKDAAGLSPAAASAVAAMASSSSEPTSSGAFGRGGRKRTHRRKRSSAIGSKGHKRTTHRRKSRA